MAGGEDGELGQGFFHYTFAAVWLKYILSCCKHLIFMLFFLTFSVCNKTYTRKMIKFKEIESGIV